MKGSSVYGWLIDHNGGGRENGYTLVEVLIGITILTVGMLAVAMIQHMAIGTVDRSGSVTIAVNIAQRYLEEIIDMDYRDPRIRDLNKANNDDLAGAARLAGDGLEPASADHFRVVDGVGMPDSSGKYSVIWNVADDTPIADTRTVVVAVIWKGGRCVLKCVKSLAR